MAADFFFRQFAIKQEGAVHPMGTDSVLLGAWSPVENAQRILDIGTGTGIVAMMLAQRSNAVRIDAVELDEATANCARENFRNSPWPDRIHVVQTTIQEYVPQDLERYDLIVSNPPFFSGASAAPDQQRRLGRHQASLRPGELIEAAIRLLALEGKFCVVLPTQEATLFQELAAFQRLYVTGERQVFSRVGKPVERILLQFERTPHHFNRHPPLYIFASDETHSAEFMALTGAFYTSF